jgi:hypothetical protein
LSGITFLSVIVVTSIFHQVGLPCRHIFHVKGEICLTYCDILWYKSYTYHFGWIPWYTQKISQIFNLVKEVGVPCVSSPPTLTAPVYRKCTDSFYFDWVMNPATPVMIDECSQRDLMTILMTNSTMMSLMMGRWLVNMLPSSPHDNMSQSTTEYAAAIQLATTPQTINHPYRFHLEAYKHLLNFT